MTQIHPLIPIPHEPSFRAALAAREDLTNKTFLALLASMIGILVSSFPRRPLHLFKQIRNGPQLFPSSAALRDRCHNIVVEARGPGYLDKELTLSDAAISYLTGLIAAYIFDMKRCRLYFGECIMILRILEVHKSPQVGFGGPTPSWSSDTRDNDDGKEVDLIKQELGRRLFYVCLVGYGTLQQLGSTDRELLIPPSTPAEPYPPLPLEVDDAYIFSTHVEPQPAGVVSELTGFNANVRIYCSYNSLNALDMAFGAEEVFDWERQKRMIGQCLRKAKAALDDVPSELILQHVRANAQSKHHEHDSVDNSSGRTEVNDVINKRRAQCEIQKANIYASQLGTRSYLVEKYFSFCDAQESASEKSRSTSSGTTDLTSPRVTPLGLNKPHNPVSPQEGLSVEAMFLEREAVVKDLLVLLRTVSPVNMEPSSTSFTHKIRQIASTLLNVPRTRMGHLATKVEMYLAAFLDVLMKLERPGDAGEGDADDGIFLTEEELEERELSHWASLKEYQARFAEAGGLLRDL